MLTERACCKIEVIGRVSKCTSLALCVGHSSGKPSSSGAGTSIFRGECRGKGRRLLSSAPSHPIPSHPMPSHPIPSPPTPNSIYSTHGHPVHLGVQGGDSRDTAAAVLSWHHRGATRAAAGCSDAASVAAHLLLPPRPRPGGLLVVCLLHLLVPLELDQGPSPRVSRGGEGGKP